jgi:hypothetical protein
MMRLAGHDGSDTLRASACSDTTRVPFKSPSMKRSVNPTHSQGMENQEGDELLLSRA